MGGRGAPAAKDLRYGRRGQRSLKLSTVTNWHKQTTLHRHVTHKGIAQARSSALGRNLRRSPRRHSAHGGRRLDALHATCASFRRTSSQVPRGTRWQPHIRTLVTQQGLDDQRTLMKRSMPRRVSARGSFSIAAFAAPARNRAAPPTAAAVAHPAAACARTARVLYYEVLIRSCEEMTAG